ncbi:phytanoyl-CoA dioxygenase family protein [Viridibacterium curvum]
MDHIDELSQHFLRNGWFVLELEKGERSFVHEVRAAMLAELQEKWVPGLKSLDEYHLHVEDDARHIEIQAALSSFYQASEFGPKLIEENLSFFKSLIGPDLHVQKFPYLRIARPGKPQDNIGIHRDTHYGSSPFELSVSIPFTDNGELGSLGVVSGTHLMSEAALPVTQFKSEDVERGSVKHKLGFLYSPKLMSDEVRASVTPVPLRPGQALAFSLSLVHGQEVNRSAITRFQSDIRVVNSMAPIQWERSVHADYYKPLCASALSQQARIYLAANQAAAE